MNTKIRRSIPMVILLLSVLWINASEAMKIEVGGTGKVTGYIRHADSSKPMEFAAVTLFSVTDSTMVAGTISNSDGSFIISMLSEGSYYLEISFPGYEKKYITGLKIQPVQPKTEVGDILLNLNAGSGKGTHKKSKKPNP